VKIFLASLLAESSRLTGGRRSFGTNHKPDFFAFPCSLLNLKATQIEINIHPVNIFFVRSIFSSVKHPEKEDKK